MNHPYLQRRPFWLGTVIALVAAAVLIAYLQRQYTTEQQELTVQMYRQVCERTAALLVGRLRHRFGAVVLETIERIDHEAVAEFQLADVTPQLRAGLAQHPFVDRFFLWGYHAPRALRDQVVFFRPVATGAPGEIPVSDVSGASLGAFYVDAEQGRALVGADPPAQYGGLTFLAEQRVFGGVPYQVIIHHFGTPPPLRAIRGIIGYTVNLSTVRQKTVRDILVAELKESIHETSPRLNFSVVDEHGGLVYGSPARHGMPTATAALDLSFFSEDVPKVFVNSRLNSPQWHLIVASDSADPPLAARPYLFVAVISLIVIALICAVTVHRQSARLSEMHSEFVSNVSHQLRTPLSLLLATAETLQLQRVRTPEKVEEYTRRLENQAARLARLVDQILRFSRIEAGLDLYEFKRLDLARLVQAALDRFDVPDSERLSSLTFEGPSDEVPVDADSTALEEVLVNLLDNALKYGDARNEVRVTVQHCGNEALVSVRDHGRGISPADLPHVFDRFYRGRSNGHQSRGFGLGLAIVNDIVRAHRGRVTVHTEVGIGSDFRVYLPVAANPT
jgi:signal transduction histidine kinase